MDKKRFILINDRVRHNAVNAVISAPADYTVTVAPKTRSTNQNDFFHAICSDLAKSKLPFFGKPRDAAAWKILLVSAHAKATDDAGEVLPGIEGEMVAIRESTASMSVRRAASLLEYSIAYCAQNGVELIDTRRGGFLEDRSAA
jgi:hypothetical protein